MVLRAETRAQPIKFLTVGYVAGNMPKVKKIKGETT